MKRSGSCAAVNEPGNGPVGFGGSPGSSETANGAAAGAAAMLNASAAAECPRVTPGVDPGGQAAADASKRPRSALSWK